MEERKPKIKQLPAELVQQKLMHWCAYQERSQEETRRRLQEFAISEEERDAIIATLISENYLNEERFAMAFAGGKFRIKQWGRNKIKMELKKHKISDYSINKALNSIPGEDYEHTLAKAVEKKLRMVKSDDRRKQFYTSLNYLVSRGFESDLVTEQLNQALEKE